MDYTGNTALSQPMMSKELEDLLMCETYFDDYTNSSLMDHDNAMDIATASSNVDNTNNSSNNNISSIEQRLNATTATAFSQAQQIAQLQAQVQALTSGLATFNNWGFDNSHAKSDDIDSSIYEALELVANASSLDSQPPIISNPSFALPNEIPLSPPYSSPSPFESSLTPPYSSPSPLDSSLSPPYSSPSPPDSSLSSSYLSPPFNSSLTPPYSSPSPLDSLLPDFNMASTLNGYPSLIIPSLKGELEKDHNELRQKAAVTANAANMKRQLTFIPLSPPSDSTNKNFRGKTTVASKKRKTDDTLPRKSANMSLRSSKTKSGGTSTLDEEAYGGQSVSAAAINIPVQSPSVDLVATPSFNFSQPALSNVTNSDLGNKIPIQRLKLSSGMSMQNPPTDKQAKQKKVAHNAIERRYRNNINDRIVDLKNVVPALYHAKLKDAKDKGNKRPARDDEEEDEDDDSAEIFDGVAAATKLNKATILRKATEYIVHLKKSNENYKEEVSILKGLLARSSDGQQLLEEYQFQESARELQRLKKESSPSVNDGNESTDFNNTSGGRVMMMLFMAVSFMGTNPVTSWNNGSSHHHEGKAFGGAVTPGVNANGEPDFATADSIGSRLDSILSSIQIWTLIKMVILVCLAYFYLPSSWFRSRHQSSKDRLYRKQSKTSIKTTSNNPYAVYRDLVASLPNPPPHGKYSLRWGIFIEALRFALRHMFGFNFWWRNTMDEGKLTRAWIRLGEIECLGGNPRSSCESLLYTCLKTLNLVELLEDESILPLCSRMYANAAIQVTLALPNHPAIAGRLSRYFWGLAIRSAKVNNGDEPAVWIQNLLLDAHEEQVPEMIDSKVWNAALYVIKKGFVGDSTEHKSRKSGRKGASACWQVTTRSMTPIEILSDFQSLHNLYIAFQHLIILITSTTSSTLTNNASQSAFGLILSNTSRGTVAHWYAVCGAAVESFWKNDVKTAETLVLQVKDLPKSPAADGSDERVLDDAIKQMIAYTLIGVTLVKRGRITEGTRILEKGRKIGGERKRTKSQEARGLESNVRTLAEFVSSICGLEAWINIWHMKSPQAETPTDEEKDILVSEQQSTSNTISTPDIDLPTIYSIIRSETISLRRKMKTEPLNKFDEMEGLLVRLCALGDMIYEIEQFDIKPGYESINGKKARNLTKPNKEIVNVGEKALRILKGYKL